MTERTRRSLLTGLGAVTVGLAGCLDRVTDRHRDDRIAWRHRTEGTVGHLVHADDELYALTMWRALALDTDSGDVIRTELLDDPDDTVCYDAGIGVDTERVYVAGCEGMRAYTGSEVVWEATDVISMKPLTAANGLVYVGDRGLTALDATDGTVAWTALEDRTVTPPSLAGDRVYVGDDSGVVHALDAADGTEQWQHETAATRAMVPVEAEGSVYVGADVPDEDRGVVLALDPTDGREQWRADSAQVLFDTAPAVTADLVLFGSGSGQLTAHERTDGTKRWTFEADEWLVSQPTVGQDGNHAYVTSNDGRCYAVSLADGTERWRVEIGYSSSPPVLAGGFVLVGSNDGVFALESGPLG